MKIFHMSQDINIGYDTYSDCVVIAKNEEEARHIHPSEFVTHFKDGQWYGTYSNKEGGEYATENEFYTWVLFHQIDKIKIIEIGTAKAGSKKGVICASFHAG